MTEVINQIRQIEIKSESKKDNFWGLSGFKSERDWLEDRIRRFRRKDNMDMANTFEKLLIVHNRFNPDFDVTTNFKDKSEMEVIIYPNYFELTSEREKEIKGKIKDSIEKHKVKKSEVRKVLNTILKFKIGEINKTKIIAEEYCKINEILVDSNGRNFFDDKGFAWEMFSGDRNIYLPFYSCLKVLVYFEMIRHYKIGAIERLRNEEDCDIEF